MEAFCDLQSPATIALQVPSFLRWEFPRRPVKSTLLEVLPCPQLETDLTLLLYCCAVDPNLTCYLPDRVSPSL